jgi:hypothetical protein
MITIERAVDIAQPIQIDNLRGNEFTGESLAHTFRITVYNGAETVPLDPSEGVVEAYFLNASGQALLQPVANCSIDSDGRAVVTLCQACYGVPGRFLFSVYYTVAGVDADNTEKTCLYAAVGNVVQSITNPPYDPGDAIGDISELISAAEQAAQAAEQALAQATAVVSYAAQTGKTDAEKAQARANIGAASVTVSGTTLIVS